MGFWRKMNGLVHMNCKQASQMYSQSVDDALPAKERIRFLIHYFACAPCRFYVAQLKWLQRAMNHYRGRYLAGEIRPSRSLSTDARKRICEALNEATGGQS